MSKRKEFNRTWNSDLAYVIGIIATDGNLSPDGRHINVTSKDKEIVLAVQKILGLQNKIGMKGNGASSEKRYYVLQFGNMNMYDFLQDIGMHKNKSKTLGVLKVPDRVFRDFFRGCIDGDGSVATFSHPESRHPQLRVRLCSASLNFLIWIKSQISKCLQIDRGWIYTTLDRSIHVLNFGKKDSIVLLNQIYHKNARFYLKRKYLIAKEFIDARVV